MNKINKIILSVVILIALGLLVYIINNKKEEKIETIPTVTKGDSIVGCYVAKLAKDVYTLNIQTNNSDVVSGILAYNNFEKDSSSGSFKGTYKDGILIGNYSFQSEGMDSVRQVIFKKVGDSFVQGFGPVRLVNGNETFDPISSVTYDSNSTFVKSNNCLEKFTDSSNTLTLEYNPIFKSINGNNIPTIDWRLDGEEKGILLASIIIPKTFMPGTNFSDAKLTVGRSTAVNAIKSCLTDVTNGQIKGGVVTISGYPFTKFSSNGAGAGNFYETTSYRGIVDGDCYAAQYTIHSTNIGNYSPDQGIKEFDKAKITNEMESILKSLRLIVASN